MLNQLTIALAVIALSGCAGMADMGSKMAGIGTVSETTSSFDDSRIVEVSPAHLYNPQSRWGVDLKLGAYWTSAHPDSIMLIASRDSSASSGNAYINIHGIDISINGSKSSYKAGQTRLSDSGYNNVARTIYTNSEAAITMPYSVFEQMITANDVRIRINTGDGFVDAVFSTERIPGGQPTALLSFREFEKRISAYRN